MDHWTVLSPDGRVLAVEEGQRRSKRGKDYVRGRSGCVEPAHRPGGEFTPHFGRGRTWRLHHLTGHYPIIAAYVSSFDGLAFDNQVPQLMQDHFNVGPLLHPFTADMASETR